MIPTGGEDVEQRRFPSVYALVMMLLVAGAAVSLLLPIWLRPAAATREVPAELQGVLLPIAHPIEAVPLLDHHGRPFGVEQLRGHWTFLLFGYTYCPDICPVTLGALAGLVAQLATGPGGEAAAPRGLFVSVDPRRDTPAVLKKYLAYFNPHFTGLVGDEAQLMAFARQVGAAYVRVPPANNTDEERFEHSTSLFLIDPQARLVGIFSYAIQTEGRAMALFQKIDTLYKEHKWP
ncbi:MAG: SCO family protein [Magnetococcus sp. DMHC-8]